MPDRTCARRCDSCLAHRVRELLLKSTAGSWLGAAQQRQKRRVELRVGAFGGSSARIRSERRATGASLRRQSGERGSFLSDALCCHVDRVTRKSRLYMRPALCSYVKCHLFNETGSARGLTRCGTG